MMHGFTARNWKLVLLDHKGEDAYAFDDKTGVSVVADGVTRDPMEFLPSNSVFGKLRFALSYPDESPARRAAEIFCEGFVEAAGRRSFYGELAMADCFEEANRRVGKWNNENIPVPDYLTKDLAGCVAAATFYDRNVLTYGFVADAGVAVYDANGNLYFRTDDEGPSKHENYWWNLPEMKGKNWRMPEARKLIRRNYRNNPSEEHSYGALTGEDSAIPYVRTGMMGVKPGEIVVAFTDGLENILQHGEFVDSLRKKDVMKTSNICRKKVESEGSAVVQFV